MPGPGQWNGARPEPGADKDPVQNDWFTKPAEVGPAPTEPPAGPAASVFPAPGGGQSGHRTPPPPPYSGYPPRPGHQQQPRPGQAPAPQAPGGPPETPATVRVPRPPQAPPPPGETARPPERGTAPHRYATAPNPRLTGGTGGPAERPTTPPVERPTAPPSGRPPVPSTELPTERVALDRIRPQGDLPQGGPPQGGRPVTANGTGTAPGQGAAPEPGARPGGSAEASATTTGRTEPGEPADTGNGDRPEDGVPAETPSGRRRWTVVAVVLLVLVGVGVPIGLWGRPLATQLGLLGPATPETAPPPSPVEVRPAVNGVGTDAPVPTTEGLTRALEEPVSASVLGELTGVVVDPATGQVLWERNAEQPLTPASTTKVLTGAAVLLALDPQSRLTTTVVAGPNPGSVVLVGGGDPTLSSLDESPLYPGAATLDDLVAQVKANAGGAVTEVLVDTGRYTVEDQAPGWEAGDMPTYVARVEPVMLDGGRVNLRNSKAPHSAEPARRAAEELGKRLGGAKFGGTAQADPNAKVLGQVQSPPIRSLVEEMLLESDNLLAEVLGRELAIATGQPPTFEGAATAIRKVLTDHGLDLTGVQLRDASGLSQDNRIPAKVLAQVVTSAAVPEGAPNRSELTPRLRPLLAGLPVAGGTGTLDDAHNRFSRNGAAAEGRGWVRAKTGTLSEVHTLAGLVVDKDGRLLVFAFMSNGGQQETVRPALDRIAATLRQCGCR